MRINLMTACLTSGDAIGNYVEMLRAAFADRHEVAVFADRGTRDRAFLPSTAYVPTRGDVLWFHYSIGSENFACLREGDPDFKVMDFHGVCPPELFADDEGELRRLAQRALAELPRLRDVFHLCIAHSDYSVRVLREAGYARVVKSPLAIGRALADAREHPYAAERLARLEYLLFVGRVVAQKDVLRAIEVFARARAKRPRLKLWIVGDRSASPLYQQEIETRIAALGIEREVGFAGKISDPTVLKAFLRHARLLLMFSRWESFCVPVVEAMGFGVPTVTTEPTVAETMGDAGLYFERDGSVPPTEFVVPPSTFVVPPSGGEAFPPEGGTTNLCADAVVELLENPERYAELRRRCLARAALFSEETLRQSLAAIEAEHLPGGGA
jgi:glycosyltransferase involved in cell wall biosynthesis